MRSSNRARRFGVRAAVAALTLLAGGLAVAPPASAAATLLQEDGAKTRTYALHIDLDRDYTRLGNRVAELEGAGAVQPVSALSVARSAQHVGRPALCHDTGLDGRLRYDGFCWDPTDDKSSNLSGGWTPQGLTGSHDADPSGTVDGHHLYIASWYMGKSEQQAGNYGRISVVESTGSRVTYGHVMLVRPVDGPPGFEPVQRFHGDGVTWYGNKLFVANGAELQVYDLRHLWKMDSREERVGVSGGKASARWHDWALPMVARYTTGPRDADPRACHPGGDELVCLSSLSLDRSGTDALVSGEHRSAAGGRVIRWDLDARTALPRSDDPIRPVAGATADASYVSPVFQMQGVATDGQTYYMAGKCPKGWVPDPDAEDALSCLHYAKPGAEPHVLTTAPVYTQNLSWAPQTRRLWGLNERIDRANGKRVIFSLMPNP
ncbi:MULTISPECIES: hypothetical protein [Actinomadura]|uniref:Secreted protein n=1 Tax=Actinomadura yumaensis TaxID=111807 RepID=A0ABW2CMV8_9ACTN|nr:hypothetical protein [Actinomadura sp. J1-007]MWK36891.1 hypothetical protein [Actinomadura sp. J1-007]